MVKIGSVLIDRDVNDQSSNDLQWTFLFYAGFLQTLDLIG